LLKTSFGAPTWSRDIANATRRIIEELAAESSIGKRPAAKLGIRRGIYHMTAAGSASSYEFAVAIVQKAEKRTLSDQGFARILPTRQFNTGLLPAGQPIFHHLTLAWSLIGYASFYDLGARTLIDTPKDAGGQLVDGSAYVVRICWIQLWSSPTDL